MKDDQNTILDDLLSRWHAWSLHHAAGTSCVNALFRQASSSRGYDDTSDIADSMVDASTMDAVDFHVDQMQEAYRAAIYAHARNLHAGCSVWSNPRLPKSPEERAVVVLEAKNMLSLRLMSAGVI